MQVVRMCREHFDFVLPSVQLDRRRRSFVGSPVTTDLIKFVFAWCFTCCISLPWSGELKLLNSIWEIPWRRSAKVSLRRRRFVSDWTKLCWLLAVGGKARRGEAGRADVTDDLGNDGRMQKRCRTRDDYNDFSSPHNDDDCDRGPTTSETTGTHSRRGTHWCLGCVARTRTSWHSTQRQWRFV